MEQKTNETLVVSNYEERTRRNHYWVGGIEGQKKIKKLKIGIAGLGGMGSNIAEIFARLGVGFLRITDPDTIERTNLNRQVIAFEDTIGKKKATSSENELRKISKDIVLQVSTDGIQSDNVESFVEGLDVIINEIDVFHLDKHLMLLEEARHRGISVYTTLVVGLGVHLYKFDPNSRYTPKDFYSSLLHEPTADNLLKKFGEPLPEYIQGSVLDGYIQEIKTGGVPIFGASTYLGQSLLAIRVLYDLGYISLSQGIPNTPTMPQFLVLDPLTLKIQTAEIQASGAIAVDKE